MSILAVTDKAVFGAMEPMPDPNSNEITSRKQPIRIDVESGSTAVLDTQTPMYHYATVDGSGVWVATAEVGFPGMAYALYHHPDGGKERKRIAGAEGAFLTGHAGTGDGAFIATSSSFGPFRFGPNLERVALADGKSQRLISGAKGQDFGFSGLVYDEKTGTLFFIKNGEDGNGGSLPGEILKLSKNSRSPKTVHAPKKHLEFLGLTSNNLVAMEDLGEGRHRVVYGAKGAKIDKVIVETSDRVAHLSATEGSVAWLQGDGTVYLAREPSLKPEKVFEFADAEVIGVSLSTNHLFLVSRWTQAGLGLEYSVTLIPLNGE